MCRYGHYTPKSLCEATASQRKCGVCGEPLLGGSGKAPATGGSGKAPAAMPQAKHSHRLGDRKGRDMATIVMCPNGHKNYDRTRSLCDVCGATLNYGARSIPESTTAVAPQPKPSLYERVGGAQGVFGIAVLLIGAIVALALFSQKGGNSAGSSGGYTAADESPNTYEQQAPMASQDDWYRTVCQLGTIRPAGNSALRSAVAGDICRASDGGILIGKYTSSLARDNDIAAFRGRARYATMADDQGYIWLFVALTPRAGAAVQSLSQFGFSVG